MGPGPVVAPRRRHVARSVGRVFDGRWVVEHSKDEVDVAAFVAVKFLGLCFLNVSEETGQLKVPSMQFL